MIKVPRPRFAEEPLISPQEHVRKVGRGSGLKFEDLEVPTHFLLSLSVGATTPLIQATNAIERTWIYRARPLYVSHSSGEPVGIIWAAPGAPLATMVMEDLVACGAKLFIGVGLIGAIQPGIDVGDCIIPSVAVRDEGTSYHYLPESVEALPSNEAVQALADSCEEMEVKYYLGPVWTTDAPYRETKSKIDYFQAHEVLGVDMESSAIFSLGIYREVKVGCILVVSSSLVRQRDTLGFYSEKLKDNMAKAAKIAIRTIEKLRFNEFGARIFPRWQKSIVTFP